MASSFTEFRGSGFWSRDPILELWLRFLALHLDSNADVLDHWLHSFRDELLFASSGRCNGWVSAQLDRFLTDDTRVEAVIAASNRAIKCIRAIGSTVPKSFLTALGTGHYEVDRPLSSFEAMHEIFNTLLLGRLDPSEANKRELS